jgi:6-phosphogluconolactonase (cycloisomerase 2 family)
MTRIDRLVFIQINNAEGNQILVYDRADDGTLTLAETVDTGGVGGRNDGSGPDPLASQGSLLFDIHHRVLIAVNAGSNTVSVFGLDDGHLRLRQVVASGGIFPVSVTVHGDLVYVLNVHEAGAITGYRITEGRLAPIEDSTRSLELTPATGPTQFLNTPAQIGFTPDGYQLVITTKANGSHIDVFAVRPDGRPSDTFKANPSNVPRPFGFTFDHHGHLAVTDPATSSLSTYTILPDGTAKQVGSQVNGQRLACWIARSGENFYVANVGTNTITAYHIDSEGTPTVFGQTITDPGPIDMAATRDGQFLYAQAGTFGGNLDAYRINPDGTLTQIATLNGLSGLEGIAAT